MDETKLESDALATDDARAEWSVDTIADQVFRSVSGTVTRETIVQIIKQVARRYEGARIQTFVPVLIQRDVMNELFTMQAPMAPPGMAIKEVQQSERS